MIFKLLDGRIHPWFCFIWLLFFFAVGFWPLIIIPQINVSFRIARNGARMVSTKTKGRKPAFTPKQVERMMHMRYTENLRCHEIASVMNTTKSTVERYTRRVGTEIHEGGK